MKKVILTSALAIFAFYTQAQITINRSDIAKSPTKIRYSVDKDYVPAAIENKGSGLTWDFKNLVEDEELITIYDDPKNHSRSANFPSANLVLVEDSAQDDVAYIEDTNDSLVVVGTNEELTDGVRFRLLIFPMSFNTTWMDKGNISRKEAGPQGGPFDSIKYDLTYTYTNTVEAEGKLKLPGGSIDVLKLYTLGETAGDIEVKMGGVWQTLDASSFKDSTYSFYAKNNGDAVLRLNKNEDGTYEASFKNDITGLVSVNRIQQVENAVRVYPNPTTNILNIESSKVDSYIITDILGKNIMQGKTNSSIDVSNLAKGNYMIQLFQNDKLMSVNKFIKD